ncbi:MAG: stage 0 sporulation family protein [Clostridia bacterium]|nr:stage 0 sporulation family protein [Clostridia bacterium]
MVEIVGVGFRNAGKTYYFSPKKMTLTLGTPVIVETARGVEMGKITIANRRIPQTEIVSPLKDIIRAATPSDVARYKENRRLEEQAAEVCREKIKSHRLEMDLVSVEYTFDNSKLLFYFTAESRVDFRELVKDLASVFKTRIELRQIGIRDEAKMMGGFGSCGRPFCCSTFLSDFVQVSIKMAKEQNFSLNSNKISGACGRLMCCLRYEHDTYEEAVKKTPTVGSYVSTPSGLGTVVEARPLAGTIKVRLDEKTDTPKLYAISDIRVIRSKGKGGLQPAEDAADIAQPVQETTPQETPSHVQAEKNEESGEKKPNKKNHKKHYYPRKGNKKQGKKPTEGANS